MRRKSKSSFARMASVLDRSAARRRVAVIRLRSLGDCVLTTPALDILKRSRPDLRSPWWWRTAFAAVFEGNPDVERDPAADHRPRVAELAPDAVPEPARRDAQRRG